ncbi:hypothetical protein Tco_0886965 [Tanacetum coccineum]
MASNKAIEHAPQCGDLTVESLTFHNNNVVGVFSYLETAPAYHEICKYLMNCPLAEAFTKTPSMVYQNFLREFWCTTIAYDPNPPTNYSKVHPLKEYKIKFSVMNGKNPLTLDFETFTESTRLDYTKDAYVSHPSTEEVKAELAKIVDDLILLDRTPRPENCISCGLENFAHICYLVLLGLDYTQDESFGSSPTILSNSNFSKGPSKVTPIELTDFMVTVNKFSSGTIPDPQDPKRNIQLASTGLPFTLDVGTHKSQPLPEGTNIDPKDSGGNVQPANRGLPSTDSDKGAIKTTPFLEGPCGDKELEGLKPPADMEPQTNPVADLLETDAKYQVDQPQSSRLSDDEKVFAAGEDMDEDTQADEEEVHSPPPNTDKPELSPVQDTNESTSDSSPELKKYDNILPLTKRQLVKYLRKVSRVLFNRITKDQWAHHEEAAVSYTDLRASIKGYYEENVDHKDQTDKLVQVTRDSLDKTATDRTNLLKALTEVNETLKVIQDAVKDDLALNKKVIEATEAYTKNLTALTELLTLNLGPRMIAFESSQAEIRSELSSLKQDTSDVKSMMTEIYQAFRVVTEEPPSYTEGETEYMETHDTDTNKVEKEQVSEEPKHFLKEKEKVLLLMINLNKQSWLKPHLFTLGQGRSDEEEAKRLAMTKTKVIKIVQEEAKKIGIDPKKVISAKACKKYERLKNIPKELGIQSALLALVLDKDQSQPSERKMKQMKLEPEIKVPGLECNRSLPKGIPFVNNMVIEEPEYGIFFTDVFGDQAFQRWNDIHKVRMESLVSYLVMASMVRTPENARFGLKLMKLIAKHPDQENLKSKKVKLKALGYKLD